MCGIFGVFGSYTTKDAIKCLKKLEYRGYDSAGIAYDDELPIKEVGRISKLDSIVNNINIKKCILHTRWATNGIVSTVNAHPHVSHKSLVTLVHNGVLENEEDITNTYLKGISFKSETDSEKIACLIEKFLNEYSPIESIKKVMEVIKGSYAILFMIKNDENIYFLKKDSALLIAYDDDNYYLSSDILAFPNTVKKYKHLPNLSFGYIGTKSFISDDREYFDFMYKEILLKNQSQMLEEIKEEEKAVKRLNEVIPEYYMKIKDIIEKASSIVIIGSGSSYYAGLYISRLGEEILKKKFETIISSEFYYKDNIYNSNTLYILISQSGETADLIAANKKINSNNKILLTNSINSTLSNQVSISLDIMANPEVSVAATKSFNQTVILMYLIFMKCIGKEEDEIAGYLANLDFFINNKNYNTNQVALSTKVFYLGTGFDYIASLEGALKLKEIAYIPTWGYPLGELKHGSLALVDENTYVIGLSSTLKSYMLHALNEVKARNGKVLFIEPPVYLKYLGALSLVTYTQMLAYYVATKNNIDPDHPRNLAKSVTVI